MRVVVHWRYALSDNWYNISRVDSLSGWGEWVDEVYTVYPDGVAVRKATLHSSNPATSFEWHESIPVMGPGQRPEDNLRPEALTFVNLNDDAFSYSWEKGIPKGVDEKGYILQPENPVIQMINTNSELRPFVIIDPEANPKWRIFRNEPRPEISMFPWWNHWPTAQNACDGRYAMDSDLASHTALSNAYWDIYSQSANTVTKIMLNGLTGNSANQLVPLAKSWSNPSILRIKGSDKYKNDGYDPSERAYQITCLENDSPEEMLVELDANIDSPVENLCLIIKNWGKSDPLVKMNNKSLTEDKEFHFGHRLSVEGTDLLIWIESETIKPIKLTISPN